MWYFQLVPGHPPAEVESNLLLAYWMGADLVYLEGSGYNLLPAGRQGTPFSLVNVISNDRYQLTPHGEMLRRFCREYLPATPDRGPSATSGPKWPSCVLRTATSASGHGVSRGCMDRRRCWVMRTLAHG